jgi:hypothetical protein
MDMPRKTEQERIADAEAKVERLKREAEIREAELADRKARGPSVSVLNRLGQEYRLVVRVAELVDQYAGTEDTFADVANSACDPLNEFAKALRLRWIDGFSKKRAYADAHEGANVELDRVKPLEIEKKGAASPEGADPNAA